MCIDEGLDGSALFSWAIIILVILLLLLGIGKILIYAVLFSTGRHTTNYLHNLITMASTNVIFLVVLRIRVKWWCETNSIFNFFSLVQWLKVSKKEHCELCKHRFSFMPSEFYNYYNYHYNLYYRCIITTTHCNITSIIVFVWQLTSGSLLCWLITSTKFIIVGFICFQAQ